MTKTKQVIATITEAGIVEKIYIIRGVKVMLDKDLAEMYAVEVKRLNESVNRNRERFPEDFMFQLSQDEWQNLKSQFATSSWGGTRKLPNAFTEQGVAMLSSVLHSETAIAVNIQIIRVFTKMKELLLDNKELFLKIERIEKKLTGHDEDLGNVFKILKKLLQPDPVKRKAIGFPYPNKK
ncbi:MAG TPA: ORF6N domain-containing protein [Ferruginibacter sp.]|nr:ORF6N domain-containing protein [Ferruginibacter sp.]